MSYEGYADKEKRREYLRRYKRDSRAQERTEVDQNKAKIEEMDNVQSKVKIEEMTWASFGDMQHEWCVKERMAAGDTEEGAKCYCDGAREEVRHIIATDIQEQMERAKEVPSVIKEVVKEKKRVVDADLLARCVKVRMDGLSESQEAAEAFCTEVLQDDPVLAIAMDTKKRLEASRLGSAELREQVIQNKYLLRLHEINRTRELDTQDHVDCRADAEREYEGESPGRPDAGLDEEFGIRTYIIQKLLGVPQKHAESHVMREMVLEGKFADVTKRTFNRESVGDLYGKTKEERIAEAYPEQSHYGKDAEAREQFTEMEERQKNRGVVMPSDPTKFPRSGRMTVGNLYGKTREQILREQQEEEQK